MTSAPGDGGRGASPASRNAFRPSETSVSSVSRAVIEIRISISRILPIAV